MQFLNILLDNPQIQEVDLESRLKYLGRTVGAMDLSGGYDATKILRYASLLQNLVISSIENKELVDELSREDIDKFKGVYYLLRAIEMTIDQQALEFDMLLGLKNIDVNDVYYFFLASSGLLSENNIKVRIDLKNYQPSSNKIGDWRCRVLTQILVCLTLLVRKKGGLDDAKLVSQIISQLIIDQRQYEEKYLNGNSVTERIPAAFELVGLYHLSKVIIETAKYLEEGYRYKGNLQTVITRHCRYAKESFIDNTPLESITIIIKRACYEVYRSSIWFSTTGLGTGIGKLCEKLVDTDKIDLLPSQRQAISSSLLDIASSATIVQMPTSAGKTLLAEFRILQTLALSPDAKIIYLVPTRALVNQVIADLRSDFEGFGLIIEKTSKVNDIDPTEELFLSEKINILVSTPEKFDLMVRRKHPTVEVVDMIIIDEAHNIREGDRGAKLELLLAIIKREKPNAKFLLLSPFLPKPESLKTWLSSGKASINPIQVDWRPADRVIMGLRENAQILELILEPSANSFLNLKTSRTIEVNADVKMTATKKRDRLIQASAQIFGGNNNTVLFLCEGKTTANKKAKMLAETIQSSERNELNSLISRFIEDEVGEETVLSDILKKRVAVHHAGLTEDSKILIEHLIRSGGIDYICATSTIAQGINFPISTVYIDSTKKGNRGGRLSANEFLNIAGRAGRTLVDNIGKVVFPYNSATNIEHAKKLIKDSADQISSALTELILGADDIVSAFKDNKEQKKGQLFDKYRSLGVLVQYLVHLLTVSEEYEYRDELTNLFKDSFGYYTLTDIERVKFIEICQTIYFDLETKYNKNIGVLKYADKTGFSVPSVVKIMVARSVDPEISAPETWEPTKLFDHSTGYLTKKIAVIGELREAQLGSNSGAGPFDPALVAEILAQWVNGDNLSTLSRIHPHYRQKDDIERVSEFVSYLSETTFKSSWGISALEGIVNASPTDVADNSHIPSYLFFGVNSKPAVGYRMIGIPRRIANNFSQFFSGEQPSSFTEVRKRVNDLSNKNWDDLIPSNSKLSGEEWKALTKILLKNQ